MHRREFSFEVSVRNLHLFWQFLINPALLNNNMVPFKIYILILSIQRNPKVDRKVSLYWLCPLTFVHYDTSAFTHSFIHSQSVIHSFRFMTIHFHSFQCMISIFIHSYSLFQLNLSLIHVFIYSSMVVVEVCR